MCYYYQCQQLNQEESSKKPEEGFWHILFKLTQASLETKDFLINRFQGGHLTLLCSDGAEQQTEKVIGCQLFSSVHILKNGHKKCELVRSLVRRDDVCYMALLLLCCYEMAGAERPVVIRRRNAICILAKHLLSSCGPPVGKYNQLLSKKCDEIWMRHTSNVLCI